MDVELIYVDEFSFNLKQNKLDNYSERGKKIFIETKIQNFTMSFILIFFLRKTFTELWIELELHNLWCYQFCSQLDLVRSSILNNEDSKFSLVMGHVKIYYQDDCRLCKRIKVINLDYCSLFTVIEPRRKANFLN